jgi:hypothetical protein
MECPARIQTAKGILLCQRVQIKSRVPHERHEWQGTLGGDRFEEDEWGVAHKVVSPVAAAGLEATMTVVWFAVMDRLRQRVRAADEEAR